MSTEIALQIPHRMGPEQALSRIKAFVTGAKREYGDLVVIHEESWGERSCRFDVTVRVKGSRRVSGTLQAHAGHIQVRARGDFPAYMRAKIERRVLAEASRLLIRVRRRY